VLQIFVEKEEESIDIGGVEESLQTWKGILTTLIFRKRWN
jgi:hypothetical protein